MLLTKIDGKPWLYIFYATQTGYRRNDGKYHYQYDRIRAMRRRVRTSEPGAPADARTTRAVELHVKRVE